MTQYPEVNERENYLIPPGKLEPYYKRSFHLNGTQHTGYLTYGVGYWNTQKRNILLVKNVNGIIPRKLLTAFKAFQSSINQYIGGSFFQQKSFVNSLLHNEKTREEHPHAGVAIHKFGPVPVFLIPDSYVAEHSRETMPIILGVVNSKDLSSEQLYLKLFNSNIEFYKSLIDLPVIIRRYLEDATACFFDLENHCDRYQALVKSKTIEETIAQSLQSKLKSIIPSDGDWKKYQNLRIQQTLESEILHKCQLYGEHKEFILLAQYARIIILYFLNELYRHLGLKSMSERYKDSLYKIIDSTDYKHYPGYSDSVFDIFPELSCLKDIYTAYSRKNIEALKSLRSESDWVQKIINFSCFLYWLDQASLSPNKGCIFVSYNHNIPDAEIMKKSIEEEVLEAFANNISILCVEIDQPGIHFRDIIKSQIWLSDIIICLLTKKLTPIGSDEEKTYLWQAREAEHGRLLDKPVVFFEWLGLDQDKVKKNFLHLEGNYLSPLARAKGVRTKTLIDYYEETNKVTDISFNRASSNDTSERISRSILFCAGKALEDRHQKMLEGYLQLFGRSTQQAIRALHEIAPYPTEISKTSLKRTMKDRYPHVYSSENKAKNAIDRMRNNLKDRKIDIIEDDIQLISFKTRGNQSKYTGTLRLILESLRPDYTPDQISHWYNRLLDQLECCY